MFISKCWKVKLRVRPIGFGVGFALLAGFATQASAQEAQGSTFNLAAVADGNVNSAGFASDWFSDSQGATLNPYSHSLVVTDLDATGGSPLTVKTSASASWVNAGKGSVSITDTGWTFDTNGPGVAQINSYVAGSDIWTYTFKATSDGIFTMNYLVSGKGDKSGLQGAIIHWDGLGGDLNLTNSDDPSASGLFFRSLIAGQVYTVGIGTYSNISTELGTDLAGSFDGQFEWQIATVPEPFSIAGLALGVTVFFRKRKKA